MRIKHLLFALLLHYTLSLGYYTGYGLYKSCNEYFCLQKRADVAEFISLQVSDIVNTGSFSKVNNLTQGYIRSPYIITLGNKMYEYEITGSQLNIFKDPINKWEKEFKVDHTYVKVTCAPSSIPYEGIVSSNDAVTFFIGGHLVAAEFNSDGHLYLTTASYLGRMLLPWNSGDLMKTECKEVRSQETCSLPQSHSDKFYLTYLTASAIYWFICILSTLNIRNYAFLRMINYFVCLINHLDIGNSLNFCNPISGKPIEIGPGVSINKIKKGSCSFPITRGLDSLKDLNGEYVILESKVLIKTKNKTELVQLDVAAASQLSHYFLQISLNHLLCVVDDNETHFLKTEEVIKSLSAGNHIHLTQKLKKSMVLEVNDFEFKVIKTCYPRLKDWCIKKLIEHNWRFYKGEYNIKALMLCLKRKTMSYDRPDRVGNSQWKRYSSDIKIMMKEFGFKHSCQSDYPPTKTLQDLNKEDISNIEIIKLKGVADFVVDVSETVSSSFDMEKKMEMMAGQLSELANFRPVNLKNNAIQKNDDYFEAVSEVCEMIPQINEKINEKKKAVKNSEDLRSLCQYIKEHIFKVADYFQENLEDLSDSPMTVVHDKVWDKGKLKQVRRDTPIMASRNFIICTQNLAKGMKIEYDKILRLENKFQVLENLEKETEVIKSRKTSHIVKINVSDYVKEIVGGKKSKNTLKKRRRKDIHNRRNKKKTTDDKICEIEKLRVEGNIVKQRYLSNNFKQCLKVVETRIPIKGCRPRTICCMANDFKNIAKWKIPETEDAFKSIKSNFDEIFHQLSKQKEVPMNDEAYICNMQNLQDRMAGIEVIASSID